METFRFDNGIVVPRGFLTDEQFDRYETNKGGRLHEPVEEALFRQALMRLPDSACYVNLGAAWGYYAILAKLLRPALEVFAVEAHARMCYRMFRALELNQVAGLTVVNKAVVGSSAVHRPMGIKFDYGAQVQPLNPGTGLAVATCDIVAQFGSLPPDTGVMVTMDIQGMEVDVLADIAASQSVRSRILEMIVGTHGEQRHDACLAILRAANFRIVTDNPKPDEQPDGIIYARPD